MRKIIEAIKFYQDQINAVEKASIKNMEAYQGATLARQRKCRANKQAKTQRL